MPNCEQLMSSVRQAVTLVAVATYVVTATAGEPVSGDRCKSVSELLATSTRNLPPLPPRDSVEHKLSPPTSATELAEEATNAVIEIVIADGAADQPQVSGMGWSAASTDELSTGRTRIAALDGVPAGRVSVDELAAESVETPERSLSASAWTVIQTSQTEAPLIEGGVFRSEALFDGVPVAVGELAPFPTSFNDDVLAGEMVALLALAPQPLLSPQASAAPNLAPVPTALGEEETDSYAPGEEATPAPFAKTFVGVAELHKPLSDIRLGTGLQLREPPDQSAAELPTEMPQQIWGEPWPATRLSNYRYTVPFEHRPLYFEQPGMERCGTGCGIFSPYVSAACFAKDVVLLPLHMVVAPPCRTVTIGGCSTSP